MNILMLSSLLAISASAQKITTQHEVVDCGQVVFRHPVTAEFQMKNEATSRSSSKCIEELWLHISGISKEEHCRRRELCGEGGL